MINIFPSTGTWALKAVHPILPAKGTPASPPSGKCSPHLAYNRRATSSFGLSRLISSAH